MDYNIVVLGNDKRMEYVAQYLYNSGYEIYREFENSIAKEQNILILPPPVNVEIQKQLQQNLSFYKIVYGGAVCKEFVQACQDEKINVIDYLTFDDVITKNAILTAKGVLKQALFHCSFDKNKRVLVLGYGFCGKAICEEVFHFSQNVDVLVRRKDLKNEIEKKNYRYLNFKTIDYNELKKYDYIFNTVPACVIDEKFLLSLNRDTRIYDIASKPGGTDFEMAKKLGIFAVNSLGIPGKEYPKEAGTVIGEFIVQSLESMQE